MIADASIPGRSGRVRRGLKRLKVMGMPIAPPQSHTQSSDLQRSARRDRVVKSILYSIFRGEVVGGDRLVEEELAERLGVSRTPIREALRELTNIGVIWLKPNHGAMVRPFGPTQLLEIYHMRRLLETEATRLACKSLNREMAREIRNDMQGLLQSRDRNAAWSESALALDQRLHELIARGSGSERLQEEIHRYWTLARSIAETVRNASSTQDRALHEHTEIIDRLLENNSDAAAKAMSRHINLRTEAALEALCPPTGRGALRELLAAAQPAPTSPPPRAT